MYRAVNAFFFLSLSPQFLCLKNIRTFLKVCHDKFGLRNSELFDPFDLFDVRDFGKVRPTSSWGGHPWCFFPPGSPSSGIDDVMVPCKAVARGDNSTCGRPVTFKTGRGLSTSAKMRGHERSLLPNFPCSFHSEHTSFSEAEVGVA